MTRLAALACGALLLAAPAFPAAARGSLPSQKQDWIRLETDHFSLFSNAGQRRTAELARGLEQLREVLERLTGGLVFDSPVETRIFVFKNDVTMEPYLLGFSDTSMEVGGYFRSTEDGNYVVVNATAGDHPFRVVNHEYLHFVMRNTIPDLPLWLDEGLAEYYSTFGIAGGKAYIGRVLPGHLQLLQSGPLLPLEELLAVDSATLHAGKSRWISRVYAQSWALTHYLLASSADQGGSAKALFAAIRQGVDSRTALERAYRTDLASLEQALTDYVHGRGRELGMFIYTPEEAFDKKQREGAEALGRAELLAGLGDLLAHGPEKDRATAREHLLAALELDPELPLAWLALARVEIEAGKYDAGQAHCAKALALDPSDPRAHAVLGEALLQRFLRSDELPDQLLDAPPPLLAEARGHFRTSLEAAPDHLPSLVGLGSTYFFADEDLAEGVQALARAAQLLPSRGDYLANLIILTARQGNLAGATTLLERGLRPRGDEEQTLQAESGVAGAAIAEAFRLANAGEDREARELLEWTLGKIVDPAIRESLSSALEQLASHERALREERIARETLAGEVERYNQAVELYNRAVEKAGEGELDEAAALLQQVVDRAEDPELRSAAESALQALRERIGRTALTDRYHEALQMLWDDDFDGAEAILREILRAEPDGRLRQAVEEALEEIEQARAAGS
jgi:Tfp pilus assembly protein PilF